MTTRIILYLDVHHEEDGPVDELDVISALRDTIVALRNSISTRDPDAEMMMSLGMTVGEKDSKVHANVLCGSVDAVELIYAQMKNTSMMADIVSKGPDMIKNTIMGIPDANATMRDYTNDPHHPVVTKVDNGPDDPKNPKDHKSSGKQANESQE